MCWGFDVLWFVCDYLRDLRETSGVSCLQIDRVLSCEYSPADYADYAEECSKLHYFAEKDRLVRLMWFWVFGFRLRKSARSAGDFWGFI